MSGSDSEDEVPLSMRMKATAEPPKLVSSAEPVKEASGPPKAAPPPKPAGPEPASAAQPSTTGSDTAAKPPQPPKAANNIVPGFSRPKPPGNAPVAKPSGGAPPASGSAQAAKGSGNGFAAKPPGTAGGPKNDPAPKASGSAQPAAGNTGSSQAATVSGNGVAAKPSGAAVAPKDAPAAKPSGNAQPAAAKPSSVAVAPKTAPVPKPTGSTQPGAAKPSGTAGAPKSAPGPKPSGSTQPAAAKPSGAAGATKTAPASKPSGNTQPAVGSTGGPKPKPAANGTAPKAQGSGMANGTAGKKRVIQSDSDSEDDLPLNARIKPPPKKPATAAGPDKKRVKRKSDAPPERTAKRKKPEKKATKEDDTNKVIKWDTLKHAGVLFPPEYQPHGVKMLYDGRPVDLTPEEEEVASMYAIMKETDYVKKDQFNKNFWDGFKKVLGSSHVIKSLSKCDFTPMYEHFMAEREQKKNLPKEEKLKVKAEKDAAEAKYKFALVDGRKEGVGNFRVEPPGLFRGRGEHPKMGMIKRRIFPRDITINIGEGEDVPEHPYPGQKWAEIRHDKTVTWLAFWKDPISKKDFKYVWLAANSAFKSDSDLAKYEKARKLKGCVDDIRAMYTRDWASKEVQKQQMGVALYFIDKLALRAGHEKDEDEADTVGCCTLKVENVECLEEPANHIKFDFLGKDSIRYENEVEVDPRVWKLVQQFCRKDSKGKGKQPGSQVFDTMDATDLNNALKDLMPGLSVKVFRTYNASITLDRLLFEDSVAESLDQKKADYDLANKEVAILCNHQRSVPKGHTGQMQKLADKLQGVKEELDELMLELKVAQGKAKPKQLKSPDKKIATVDQLKGRIDKKREQLAKLQVQERSKEDLKTVALGTSKINYLDPRITIAWCKRQEVPIEKVFNKSLITKFHWAMDADPEFKF